MAREYKKDERVHRGRHFSHEGQYHGLAGNPRKYGWEDIAPSAKNWHNTVNNTGGGAGRTFQQKPIPGPVSPGQPVAMRHALSRKALHGTATGAAGTLR